MANLTVVTGFLLMGFSNIWELQLFLMVLFSASELFLLTVMSYDRYVAIYQPLHYEFIMTRGACVKMAAASWLSGGLFGAIYSTSIFTLHFCGSKDIHQFFCDVPSLLQTSCSETHLAVDVPVAFGTGTAVFCSIYITISYSHIFSTVLKMPTREGRSKAFSTFLAHLIVLTVFITTAVIAYLMLPQESDSLLDLLLPMLYTVVPPTKNPIIYSLKNKDMKTALMKLIDWEQLSKGLIPKSFP
ncbi:olfactory receptor 14A2-like [Vombatus ursinus]|uniref:olfactory receptor 14A2-like n=1 Tax=Vombatus ursinus TaxID=29139 RepID=UPI000FFCE217|nr:olfactory receptor 14A2-like [Vombatus ursinus]